MTDDFERSRHPWPAPVNEAPGSYWTAERPSEHVEDEGGGVAVSGDVVRFTWDYGVTVPLWDRHGHLPEAPAWLRAELRLSDSLIHDLGAWGAAMRDLDENERSGRGPACRDLDRRALTLVDRLRAELGDRFTVVYDPW